MQNKSVTNLTDCLKQAQLTMASGVCSVMTVAQMDICGYNSLKMWGDWEGWKVVEGCFYNSKFIVNSSLLGTWFK